MYFFREITFNNKLKPFTRLKNQQLAIPGAVEMWSSRMPQNMKIMGSTPEGE
jgi:hypothetical protein